MAIFSNGKQLGRYVILNALGSGGMGGVYRARDRSLGRPVALKILSPDISSSPVLKARFEREAKIISTLHHPNICSVYDLCYEEDTEFLVMEFLEGELLSERLKKGPLPSGEAISVALEVTDALDSAHRRGIIHRDLKPGNIMLTRSGTKVMDFGLVRTLSEPALGERLTSRAPSLITGGTYLQNKSEAEHSTLAPTSLPSGPFYTRCWGGKPAFIGPSADSIVSAILKEAPSPLKIAPGLERIVRQSLEKNPDRRFQTASDLRTALIQAERSVGKDEPGGTPDPPGSSGADLPDRRANFWISERALDSTVALIKTELYTGNFRIGSPVPASLIPDELAGIPNSDVLMGCKLRGLLQLPIFNSSRSTLQRWSGKTTRQEVQMRAFDFSLTIPGSGESKTISFDSVLLPWMPTSLPTCTSAMSCIASFTSSFL